METIIYTDNKRQSTDYTSDKTLFAERIDVNHILNTEVYQSHISKVMFWVVRNNIPNQEAFAIQVCKNLVNRGFSIINFQYTINEIQYGPLPQIIEESKTASQRVSRKSSILDQQMYKTVNFPSNFKKSYLSVTPTLHNKTSSNFQNTLKPTTYYQQKVVNDPLKVTSNKTQNKDEARLANLFKEQHSISTLNQFISVLNNKENNWKNSKYYNEDVLQRKKVIVTYTFKQSQFSIEVSVINEGAKKYLQTVIQLDVSQTLNKNFNNRKNYFQSDRILESISFKSSVRLVNETKQTYHKILLFLFTIESENEKDKISKALNLKQKYVNSLAEWKIKDQDINMTQKLSKQYVLIKQQIQNQKLNFRNKVKIFEAIIGQSINVEKLLNQQKELENTSNALNANPVLMAQMNVRLSLKSSVKQIPVANNPPGGNTEFKRLKQSFQMIRNIDNIINQQNKKIQNYKKIHKETLKQKNETLYRHAKALNTMKKQIKSIRDQIKQKQIQLQIKYKTGYAQKIQHQKNFDPTQTASKELQKNVGFFQKIIGKRKSQDNQYQKQEEFQKQQQKKTKQFAIRRQYKSLHKEGGQIINKTSNETSFWIKKLTKQDEFQLKQRRKEQVEHQTLLMNLSKNNLKTLKGFQQSNNQFQKSHQNILTKCYEYYQNNRKIIEQALNSIKYGIKTPFKSNQSYMNSLNCTNPLNFSCFNSCTFKNNSINYMELKKSKIAQSNLIQRSKLQLNQLKLNDFPILQALVNPYRSSNFDDSQFDQCSLISQTNHPIQLEEAIKNVQGKQQNMQKRLTIQNLVMIQNNKKNQMIK